MSLPGARQESVPSLRVPGEADLRGIVAPCRELSERGGEFASLGTPQPCHYPATLTRHFSAGKQRFLSFRTPEIPDPEIRNPDSQNRKPFACSVFDLYYQAFMPGHFCPEHFSLRPPAARSQPKQVRGPPEPLNDSAQISRCLAQNARTGMHIVHPRSNQHSLSATPTRWFPAASTSRRAPRGSRHQLRS